VMGHKIPQTEQHVQGLYKASMNQGTSQVNMMQVADNKAKIEHYKQRMLGQKQELGHMAHEKATSVKEGSYLAYSSDVFKQGYLHQAADARDNKSKDQRVQVVLASNGARKPNDPLKRTESREMTFTSASKEDSKDMISQLKATNVALSFAKGLNAEPVRGIHSNFNNEAVQRELGQNSKMYREVQRRDF